MKTAAALNQKAAELSRTLDLAYLASFSARGLAREVMERGISYAAIDTDKACRVIIAIALRTNTDLNRASARLVADKIWDAATDTFKAAILEAFDAALDA